MQKTKSLKKSEIKREWHEFDAKNQVLGRLSTKIATLLMGKEKPCYTPHIDCGDYVVLKNIEKIRVTGKKKTQKVYQKHSGYPGGFKEITFAKQMEKDPKKIIKHAVSGMLAKNKLKDARLNRLKLFVGDKHNYTEKFKENKKD